MQVEAIYNQGRIEFAQPLRLKHDNIRLVVTVPDEEVELAPFKLPPELVSKAQAMIDKYQAILNAPLPADELLPELGTEYDSRLQAIDLRAQIRQEQGRQV